VIDMAFMRKDVNIILLLLIVITIAGFVGFSVYYETTFHNISTNYNTKISELQKVTNELTVHKSKLDETSYELEIKEERESDLKTKYEDIKDEKEKLEDEKAKLTTDLTKTKSELEDKKTELTQTQADLVSSQAEVTAAQEEMVSIKNERDTLRDILSEKEARLDACCPEE